MKQLKLSAAIKARLADLQAKSGTTVRGECLIFAQATDAGDELFVYGDIGESWWNDNAVTPTKIAEQLATLSAKSLTVRVNSYGGSVVDGVAIHNAFALHKARTGAQITTRVDGIAASIAALIFQIGDKRVMPANTSLMVHAPWTGVYAVGNATELEGQMQELVDWLRHFEATTATSFAVKSGMTVEEFRAKYYDGKDHLFTAAEAVAAGFADEVEVAAEPAPTEDVAARLASLANGLARYGAAPQALAAMQNALRKNIPAALAAQVSSSAAAGNAPPANAGNQEVGKMDKTPEQLAAERKAAEQQAAAAAHAAKQARNVEIKAMAEPHFAIQAVRDYYDQVVAAADPAVTAADFGKQVLALMAKGREPLGGNVFVPAGGDEADKFRAAATNSILVKANVLQGEERARVLQGNPMANASLISIAEQCLMRAGVRTRDMSRDDIAHKVLAQQTTSDFSVLLENALHKVVLAGYALAAFTWSRFCKIGMLSDYRAHGRYQLSSFSDLKEVGENGEYENGVLGDGNKETITAKRKGRILQLTPEVLTNDDLGFLVDLAKYLGTSAGRTIEKDVYALLAQNGGLGPAMADGKTLFHADHGNIDSSAAAPTVASLDAGAQLMAAQMDIGANDYLDLTPDIWLGPKSKSGAARVVVNSEFDPDTANKLQRFNISRNIVRDIVDSARLSGTRWYMFANPAIAPVLEVAFLNGIQEPRLEQETNFRTDGLSWKVTHKYGVGAIDTKGATTNAGA